MSVPSTYRARTSAMRDALASMGWDATVEDMAGGFWGVVLRTDDDETDVLVSAPEFTREECEAEGWSADEGGMWLVRPFCQSHPEYDAASDLPIADEATPWATAQAVSRRAILVAKYGPHACPDCD